MAYLNANLDKRVEQTLRDGDGRTAVRLIGMHGHYEHRRKMNRLTRIFNIVVVLGIIACIIAIAAPILMAIYGIP